MSPAREEVRRLPAIVAVAVLVAAVVAGGLVLERRGDVDAAEAAAAGAVQPVELAPLTPVAGVGGATWFCAAGTAVEGGFADHDVVIANTGDAAASATVTVYAGAPSEDAAARATAEGTEPVVEAVELPARTRVVLSLRSLLAAPYASALVEVAGAGADIVVEHVLRSDDDLATAPCATRASSAWHVAAGSTLLGSQELLALFNPFPDDAVVDIRFATPEGTRTPPEFEGFVVPARTTLVVDVGLVVSRHPQVSTTVSARAGRLVVERLQRFTESPTGMDVAPAAPRAAEVWHFAEGLASQTVGEVVTVYNPGDTAAEVDVELVLAPSDDPNVVTSVEPVQLSVPAGGFAQADLGADERLPDGLGHSITVRSQNGVAVVAERWQRSSGGGRVGLATTLGSPVVATRWSVAAGGIPADGGQSEFLVLYNPSVDDATVTVTVATGLEQLVPDGLDAVVLPAGERLVLDLSVAAALPELPLVVTSTVPIVVERGLYRATGFAQSMAVANAEGAAVPPADAGVEVVIGGDPAGPVAPAPTQPVPGAEATTTTTEPTTTTTAPTTSTASTVPLVTAPPG